MSFMLTKEKTIIVYGATEYGKLLIQKLRNNGYLKLCYADRRAIEIEKVDGIKVYDLINMPFEDNKDESVVIICLQNALQHMKVACDLKKVGFNNILFIPLPVSGKSTYRDSCMRNKYIEVVSGEQFCSVEIPTIIEFFETTWEEQYSSIIFRNREYVSLWVPIELLYSPKWVGEPDSKRKCEYNETSLQYAKKYRGLNISLQEPHMQLFYYLRGEREECELYLKIYSDEGRVNKTYMGADTLLRDRWELVRIYENALGEGMTFFEESPLEGVVVNKRITIWDGFHRGCFLMVRGFSWLPIKLSISDYKNFFCNHYVNQLKDYLMLNGISATYAQIPHSYFYNFPTIIGKSEVLFLQFTYKVLHNHIKDNINIFDCSGTQGFFARIVSRMFDSTINIQCVDSSSELVDYINKVSGISDIAVSNDLGNYEIWADIVFFDYSLLKKLGLHLNPKNYECTIVCGCPEKEIFNEIKDSIQSFSYFELGERKQCMFIENTSEKQGDRDEFI